MARCRNQGRPWLVAGGHGGTTAQVGYDCKDYTLNQVGNMENKIALLLHHIGVKSSAPVH